MTSSAKSTIITAMKQHLLLSITIVVCLSLAVSRANEPQVAAPIPVKISVTNNGFQLHRNGKPYLVRGVGGEGSLELLAKLGGNSVRTWGTERLQERLDAAHRLNLTVCVGIWLGHRRHGFDYNDADQVAKQAETVRETVEKFKHHPAVLLWALGNEMEGYEKGDDASIWSAINNLAVMVHKLDPHHPTMTVVAEIGGDRVKNIHRLCPDVDVVGINTYAGGASIPKRYREAGGTKPYLLTEFGPPGSWETKKNAWGAAPELSSTEKAAAYRKTYEANITADINAHVPVLCLGSYAFLWGRKQEASATWFGILGTEDRRLAAADVLSELWAGRAPANRCPTIDALKLLGPDRAKPSDALKAELVAADPENNPLEVRWVLQADPSTLSVGGDAETPGEIFPDAIVQSSPTSCDVKLPSSGGGYRLFAFVTDDHGGAAVANIPLYVDAPIIIPKARAAVLPLIIYDEADRNDPAYAPSGWMGNAKGLKVDPESTDQPHAGKTCLKATYSPNDGWVGVVWQSPANDWGDRPGGWDLTGAKRLKFWARGAVGGEIVSFEFGLLGKDKKFSDTAKGKLAQVTLTNEWHEYEIALGDQDLTRIKTGFAFTVTGSGKPTTFYLDDVRFE